MSEPKDYYFHVQEDIDDFCGYNCFIAIMLAKDFDASGSMNHTYLEDLESILPDDYGEIMEAVYGCDRNLEALKKELLDMGFIESEAFSKQIVKEFGQ